MTDEELAAAIADIDRRLVVCTSDAERSRLAAQRIPLAAERLLRWAVRIDPLTMTTHSRQTPEVVVYYTRRTERQTTNDERTKTMAIRTNRITIDQVAQTMINESLDRLEAENNTNRDVLRSALSKFRKDKALQVIAETYPDYEPTDVYTVRDNLEAAYQQIQHTIDVRRAANAKEMAEPTDDTTDQPVAAGADGLENLLAELKLATGKAAKNIRAKLRRLGYYLSQQKSTPDDTTEE